MKQKQNNLAIISQLRGIDSRIDLTPNQKKTERILLITKFSKAQQAEMFRVLRMLVSENESTLHYHCNSYLKYLLERSNDLFSELDWDYEGFVMDSAKQPA